MEIPWYINRHTLIFKKKGGKPRMIGGQFVVVRVGVHQLSKQTEELVLVFYVSLLNGCN